MKVNLPQHHEVPCTEKWSGSERNQKQNTSNEGKERHNVDARKANQGRRAIQKKGQAAGRTICMRPNEHHRNIKKSHLLSGSQAHQEQ